MEKNGKTYVDFKKINMGSTELWTDNMSKSSFVFDSGNSKNQTKTNAKHVIIKSSSTSKFANKFR